MKKLRNTFILGLGHQRCGTSWVYSYLSQSPYFCKGMAKEYHIWDALDIAQLKKHKIDRLLHTRNIIHSARYAMQNHPDFYFEYFSSLYSSKNSIAADITPSYSGLKANRLEYIREGFKNRNIQVKVLILIRDPLARIKSAVRFNLDRKNYYEGINNGELDFSNALEQYYKSEDCTLRTNYEAIITQAKNVFNDEHLYVGIYENMFTHYEIARLSSFLDVDLNIEYAGIKVNKALGLVGETDFDLKIKEYYSDVYKFCFDNYPITQELWDNSHEKSLFLNN